jgi:hypothetical protein
MISRVLSLFVLTCIVACAGLVARQPSPDEERRAAITVLRAINTAENAVMRKNDGTFVALPELLNHPAMGRVRATIVVNGNTITHLGATIRLALSADARQYQVAVVPGNTCGWAAFSDERGLIYTGRVLDC